MHIKIVAGFLLSEVLIYMVLVSSIILMAMNFFVQVTFVLNHRDTEFNRITYTHAVLDMITRVLQEAPPFKDDYKYLSHDCVIWSDKDNDRDMALQKMLNKLVIIKGQYDIRNQEWAHKRTQVLLENIENFTLDYKEHKTAAGMIITLFTVTLKPLVNKLKRENVHEIKKIILLNNVLYDNA